MDLNLFCCPICFSSILFKNDKLVVCSNCNLEFLYKNEILILIDLYMADELNIELRKYL